MADRRERHIVELRVDAAQFAKQIGSMDKNLQSLNRTAANTQRSFSGFTRGLTGLATVGVGFHQLTQALGRLSEIQTVNNQLKTIADSTGELNAMQTALIATANESRVAYDAVVTTYTRLTRATETLGLSQTQLLQITENISKGLVIGGANAKEAASSMYQLSQAFASNRLAGDEFRSLSENFPLLLQILSDHLNVTIGALKKMGSEGELTGKILSEALLGATAEIDEAFSKTSVSLGQALQVLNNQIDMTILNFEESTGVLSEVAQTMVLLASNTKLVEASLLGLSTLITGAMLAGLVALGAAVGVVGLVVAGLSVTVGLAYYYWEDILDIWNEIAIFMRYDFVAALKTLWIDTQETFAKISVIYDEQVNEIIRLWNTFKQESAEGINTLIDHWNRVAAMFGQALIPYVEFTATQEKDIQNVLELEAHYAALRQGVSQWAKDGEEAYRAHIALQKDLAREIDRFRAKLPGLSDKTGTPAPTPPPIDKAAEAAAKQLDRLTKKILESIYIDYWKDVQDAVEKGMKFLEESAKAQADAIENLKERYLEGYSSLKEYTDGQLVLNQALIDGTVTLAEYTQMMEKLKETTGVGLTDTQSLWLEYRDVVKGVFNDIAASVADFATGGETSIKDMIKSWEKQFIQFALNSAFNAVLEAINKIMGVPTTPGSGGGGLYDWAQGLATSTPTATMGHAKGSAFDQGKVIAMAKGSVVSRPTIRPMANGDAALMGEAGPEGVLPLKRGKGGKLGVQAYGGGVTVNVNNFSNSEVEVSKPRPGPDGSMMIDVMVKSSLSRLAANGQLDRSLGQNYGLSRRGSR